MDTDVIRHRNPVDAAGYVMVWNVVMHDIQLSPAARLLYGLLCNFERGSGCFPKQETLARLMGKEGAPCTVRSVFNYLSELKMRGLLTVRRRGQGRSNEYILEDVREVYKDATKKAIIDRKPISTQIDRKPISDLDRKPISTPLNQSKKKQKEETTLNVGKPDNFVAFADEARAGSKPDSDDYLSREVTALVEELRDWGSERRHRQLLCICDQYGLTSLVQQALIATRKRQSREGKSGPLEKPGAYYQTTLIKLLEEKQVFVPKASDGDDPDEVRRLVLASLTTFESDHC